MRRQSQRVEQYARVWPREIFYYFQSGSKKKVLARGLGLLEEKGVYVLYRNDIPYYVGQAGNKLRYRLWEHACVPGARYHNFWNYFSAFVIPDRELRNLVEGILIAAMPTANGARPLLKRAPFSPDMRKMMHDLHRYEVNPRMEFEKVNRQVEKVNRLLQKLIESSKRRPRRVKE